MVAATPEAYVATMSKAKRTGRIFIDYFRNDYTATAIADYAVRARPGAPVALPIDWKELKDLEVGQSIYDEGCTGTIEEEKACLPSTFAPYHSCGLITMASETSHLSNAEIADRLAGLAQLLSDSEREPL